MKLHSKIYGEKGQDLIIIHGLFGMSDNWNSLGKKFSKYCKVHLIDLRNHGRSSQNPYHIDEVAPKYMPSNIQASLALGQFERIEELIDRKRSIFKRYEMNFSSISDVQFNNDNNETFNGAWATTLIVGEKYNIKNIELMKKLSEKDIPSRPFFLPLTSMPAYKAYAKDENPNCYDISSRGITLAAHYLLKNEEIDLICEEIINILRKS